MEGDDNAGGALLADVGQAHVTLEGDTAVIAQVVEQHLLTLAVADGLGSAGLLDSRLGAHDALVQAAGEHVLVGYAVIHVPVAVVVWGFDRFFVGFGDIGLDHRLAVDIEHFEGHMLLRAAVHLRRRLDHVNLFLAAHTGDIAVVFHADEQVASAVVGKGGNRAGNLAGIGNLVLEVLMLVFALGNKVLYIMAFPGLHFLFNKL